MVSYNRQLRERHMAMFRKKAEKIERIKLQNASGQTDTLDSELEIWNREPQEAQEMRKINQKFDKLMSFDLEKTIT